MKSLLLISVVFAAIAIPLLSARDPNPGRGLRRMMAMFFAFNALYLAYLILVHTRLFVPHWP